MQRLKKIANQPKRHIPTRIVTLLFLILSLLPLLWLVNNLQFPISGEGDFLSPISQEVLLEKRLFIYDPTIHGGVSLPFHPAGIMLTGYFYILKELDISYAISSVLLVSLLLFIAEMCMYFFTLDLLRNKLKIQSNSDIFLAAISAILYTFSPFFASFLEPGHFALLIPYSLFPLIILLVNRYFLSTGFNVRVLLQLFFVFFFCATSFENIAIIYTILVALGFYILFITIIERLPLISTGFKFLGIFFVIFASNIWWLLPFLLSIGQAISQNNATNSINQALDVATKHADIYKLFFSQDPLFGQRVTSYWGAAIPFSYLLIFSCIALLKVRNRILTVFLLMVLAGIFITKGPQEPFGDVFMWFYNNFPGFQVFRRPVHKFYWVYYFFLLALSFGGISYISKILREKFRLAYIYIPLTTFSLFFVVSFLITNHMSFFTIPKYYYDAKEYLIKENVNKVVIIPGFYGDSPYYNKSVNLYHGDDFIKYVWNFQTLVPDPSSGTLATLEKKNVNRLMSDLREGKSICLSAKEDGVSHIMVRQDILSSAYIEDKPEKLIELMSKSTDVRRKQFFGNQEGGFTLFSLKDSCRENVVGTASGSASTRAYFTNPARVFVQISGLKETTPLVLNLNYDSAWKIYLVKNDEVPEKIVPKNYVSGSITQSFIPEFSQLKDAQQLGQDSHTLINGYANSWSIDPEYIVNNFSPEYYIQNADGSITVNFVIYYTSQLYFYLGLAIEAILFSVIIIYFLQSFLRAKK